MSHRFGRWVSRSVARGATAIDDYLVVWVVLAAAIGLAIPRLAVLTPLSTPILAVMIGSVSLTLSPDRIRRIRPRPLVTILLAQAGMPALAFGLARALGLSPELTVGFVVLGAVTPELVTPVMTELGDGDTALSTAVLLFSGVAIVGFVPLVLGLLEGDVASVDRSALVTQLLLAVVLPMSAAVLARWRWPTRIGSHDERYPSVAALMIVLIVAIVTAANAQFVFSSGSVLLAVAVGAVALNVAGYAVGWLVGSPFARGERIAAVFCVGMRDFAVAAALLVAAGFPPVATLPAVVFGVVEMITSAGLARRFAR